MDFAYGENPFVSFGDDDTTFDTAPIHLKQAEQEFLRVIKQIEQHARQSDKTDERLLEFFYMSMVFACKATLYFLLQDAYERGFYSANL